MKRVLLAILIFCLPVHGICGESGFDWESAIPADNETAIKSILISNQLVHPGQILQVCKNNESWCSAYYVSVVHFLSDNGKKYCAPKNKDKTLNINGISAIIESWLLRQPTGSKISFSNSVYKALTEHERC